MLFESLTNSIWAIGGFRTHDRLFTKQVLYQLSYDGIFNSRNLVIISPFVARVGFEPTSFGLWDRAGASPVHLAILFMLAGTVGFEPTTITLTGCRSTSWAIFQKMNYNQLLFMKIYKVHFLVIKPYSYTKIIAERTFIIFIFFWKNDVQESFSFLRYSQIFQIVADWFFISFHYLKKSRIFKFLIFLEQMSRIELSFPAWQAGTLTIVLHLQRGGLIHVSFTTIISSRLYLPSRLLYSYFRQENLCLLFVSFETRFKIERSWWDSNPRSPPWQGGIHSNWTARPF